MEAHCASSLSRHLWWKVRLPNYCDVGTVETCPERSLPDGFCSTKLTNALNSLGYARFAGGTREKSDSSKIGSVKPTFKNFGVEKRRVFKARSCCLTANAFKPSSRYNWKWHGVPYSAQPAEKCVNDLQGMLKAVTGTTR